MGKPGRGGGTGKGKPKGYKAPDTIERMEARAHIKARVLAELDPMLDAQFANAKGLRHTFMREKSGKFVMLTDPKDIETALNSGDDGKYYWTFTKDPNVQAFAALMDQALGKPRESVDMNVHHDLDGKVAALLQQGRDRLTHAG